MRNYFKFIFILFFLNFNIHAQCLNGESQFIIDVVPHENWEFETSWNLKDSLNNIIANGTYGKDTVCFQTGKSLFFTIFDSYGDGIGSGSYNLNQDGKIIVSHDEFTFSKTYPLNFSSGKVNNIFIKVFDDLLKHCDNTINLTPSKLNEYIDTIKYYRSYLSDNIDVIKSAFDVIDCYEVKNAPLFLNDKTKGGFPNKKDVVDGFEFERTIFTLMQELFNAVYSNNNPFKYRKFLDGKKYQSSSFFPGNCSIPSDSSKEYEVTLNATMQPSWGYPTAWSRQSARRPTGFYLSPGTFAKIKVPSNLVNKGYKIQVGAHPEFHPSKEIIKRFFKVFCTYDITDTLITIASPFGGGIYLITPYPASEGLQKIKLSNVVPAPFFSATNHNKTSLNDWQNIQRKNVAPWADFESENYMMQVPTSFIYNYDDPVKLMDDWNVRIDAISDVLGYPKDKRNNQPLYIVPDVDILHGSLGIGFPQGNNMYDPYEPFDKFNGNSNYWFLVPGSLSLSDDEMHELGHAEFTSMFKGEGEAIVNLLHAIVLSKYYGMDIDSAFGSSFARRYQITRDQAAINWMITNNFRLGKPMDISNTSKDEVRYQHRGYAKYVEIAALFGWDALQKFHYQLNIDYNKNKLTNELSFTDDRILRLSIAAEADLRPLIHFWGIHPENPTKLEQAIKAKNLQPSSLICNRLYHYKSIIPMDSIEFKKHAEIFNPDESNGSPDYGKGWYDSWLPKYKQIHGDSASNALQIIIDTYFSGDCDVVNTPQILIEDNSITVFPNPNKGQFTVKIEENSAEINIFNIVGQQIYSSITNQKNTNIIIENSGIYLVKVKTENNFYVSKIFVNK
jgi:hypothetical protein